MTTPKDPIQAAIDSVKGDKRIELFSRLVVAIADESPGFDRNAYGLMSTALEESAAKKRHFPKLWPDRGIVAVAGDPSALERTRRWLPDDAYLRTAVGADTYPGAVALAVLAERDAAESRAAELTVLLTMNPLVLNEMEPHEVFIAAEIDGELWVQCICKMPNFAQRNSAYELGEMWLAYLDEDENKWVRSSHADDAVEDPTDLEQLRAWFASIGANEMLDAVEASHKDLPPWLELTSPFVPTEAQGRCRDGCAWHYRARSGEWRVDVAPSPGADPVDHTKTTGQEPTGGFVMGPEIVRHVEMAIGGRVDRHWRPKAGEADGSEP